MAALRGNVFSIPPGARFLTVLAQSLCNGTLVDSFRLDPGNPLSLADATIYLPTRRAARMLRSEFVDILGGRSAILPTIRPLGETDGDSGFFEEEMPASLSRLPPIGSMTRLVELARLILAWRNRLPREISEIHEQSPLVAPASPADAIWLARSLIELIDSVETEETGWEGVELFGKADRALWWQLTGEFVKIASAFWPARLAELERSSPAEGRNRAIRDEAERLDRMGSRGPVIVAGSTGSIPATAELIAAISRLTTGAVVLPGLDFTMSARDWQMAGALMDDLSRNKDPASRSHPQYGLFHLLQKLGVDREDVREIGEEPDEIRCRIQAASVAFSPPEAEFNALGWRERTGQAAIDSAFGDISLIEAANEREEALAIAVAIKMALDGHDPTVQAALVTPDRALARRVCTELHRFGIESDDSAGVPLATSHHGSLLRLALDCILRPGDPVALASLIKHPLVRLGRAHDALAPTAQALEMLVMRGGTAPVSAAELPAQTLTAIEKIAGSTFPKRWQRRLRQTGCQAAMLDLAEAVARAVEPMARMLASQEGERMTVAHPLAAWAEATGRVLENLCAEASGSLETLWSGAAGDALAGLLKELMATGDALVATGPQWADVAAALLAGVGIRPEVTGHPRVFIWGTLEARLQSVDTLVLGGLNEGSWPGTTANNPFLSRAMKTEIGLEPPERRIGQSAHDFVMSLGTRKLVLSRSLRQGGAPSVASRFLQRLMSVAGVETERVMKARGQVTLSIAGQLDIGEQQPFSPRPAPVVEADRQPSSYSFSEAGTLRRDPYAVYARRVLKLDPLDGYNQDPGVAERGTLYHRIAERFISRKLDPRADGAIPAIEDITHKVFDEAQLPPHLDIVWRARALDMARALVRSEIDRWPEIKESLVEQDARHAFPSGLSVHGRADRIDILKNGLADIIDYKTGASPSTKVARTLLDPQLSLEAAVLKAGGFKDIKALETNNLMYVRLRAGDRFTTETVNNENGRGKAEDKRSAPELAEKAIAQLGRLDSALKRGSQGFKSRVAPIKASDHGGDYDHLARVAEWATADSDEEGGDE